MPEPVFVATLNMTESNRRALEMLFNPAPEATRAVYGGDDNLLFFKRHQFEPICYRHTFRISPRAAATSHQPATAPGGAGRRWILATEQPAKVYDWQRGEFVDEVLLIDGIAIPDHLPLLDSHSRESVGNVIGSVRDIRVTTAGGYRALEGEVVFSDADEISRSARAKVEEGHITDGSIGYRVDKSAWVDAGQTANILGRDFAGPLKVSYQSELKEFSVCPIGADSLAKVRAALLVQGQKP